ncbi:MAG: tetratricopeptide repeat protein [Pseudomonadota bacterium]
MRARGTAALLITALLAACSSGGLQQFDDSPFAPVGRVDASRSVDGLVVGHRLMAAGEYELALNAYSRAAAENGMSVDVLSALGSANLKLGRLGQAERLLRRATEEDGEFPPAWNNLGVVLMERREYGEAARVFRVAFALDSGENEEIRDNLRVALAKIENPSYSPPDNEFALVRRGTGSYLILETP